MPVLTNPSNIYFKYGFYVRTKLEKKKPHKTIWEDDLTHYIVTEKLELISIMHQLPNWRERTDNTDSSEYNHDRYIDPKNHLCFRRP